MVHFPSTIAITTLALGATSALARYPFYADALEARAPSASENALPTKTVRVRAKPTACKPGEEVSWPPAKPGINLGLSKSKSSKSKSKSVESSATVKASPKASPTPAATLAARAPSEGEGKAQPVPQVTPAPKPVKSSTKPKGAKGKGKVLTTVTHPGADGKKTVYHVLAATTTRCFDPKQTGAGKLTTKAKAKAKAKGHAAETTAPAKGAETTAPAKGAETTGSAKNAETTAAAKNTETSAKAGKNAEANEVQKPIAGAKPKLTRREIELIARYILASEELD